MRGFLPTASKVLSAILFLTISLVAQTGLGVVTGTVQDPSKATVPNALVTLTKTDTGLVRTSNANSSGLYYFGSLQVGPYHLVVEATGFEKWETDFTIQAGQTVTVDPAVSVGAGQ